MSSDFYTYFNGFCTWLSLGLREHSNIEIHYSICPRATVIDHIKTFFKPGSYSMTGPVQSGPSPKSGDIAEILWYSLLPFYKVNKYWA